MNKGVQLNALDPNSLGDLKRLARSEGGSDAALRAAARQFEGLFLQMVMKSMRATTGQNGMMDSEQTRSWQGMLDQQMALEMSQSGGTGLSEMLYRQLGGKAAVRPDAAGEAGKTGFDLADVRRRPAIPAVLARDAESAAAPRLAALPAEARVPALGAAATAGEFSALSVYERAALQTRLDAAVRSARDAGGEVSKSAQDFVTEVWPHAQEASRRTGIPAEFMVAQAALETGWGQKQLRHEDGSPSHNLFNIKAGSAWSGRTVAREVTEYADGQAYTEAAHFRSYGSYAESFRDYAQV
ncbi:flagellar assembly peptidoglycan hydrolase FlgJ, partial [Thauera aminoaromatica]